MKFYITTPIYYVNDVPHIGHAYTTIAADVQARFRRLCGYDVFFLTGTDEHGKKIEKAAREKGISPKELADEVHLRFKELWKVLSISYTKFIRTTDPEHEEAVREFWMRMKKSGSIYKGKYVGWYCVPCESFWSSAQIEDRRCPECGRELEILEEETYFFRVGDWKEKVKRYIEETDFVLPEFRRSNVLDTLKDLRDISISRPSDRVPWGIRVPDDPTHTIYVWVDALTNYISAIGYPSEHKRWWPADYHLVGKDIIKFHAIYWPMFLMSAGEEPPKHVFAHGWWKVQGQKMSKSLRNVVDPFELSRVFGTDAIRFFMMRHVPFGRDGDFSEQAIRERYEFDLAKDFGNLVLRVIKFAEKNFGGKVERKGEDSAFSEFPLREVFENWRRFMEQLDFYNALAEAWKVVSFANKFLDSSAPWHKVKTNPEEAERSIYLAVQLIRAVAVMLYPFMPSVCGKVARALGHESMVDENAKIPLDERALKFEDFYKLSNPGILFPKIS